MKVRPDGQELPLEDPASATTVLTDTQEFDLSEEAAITRDFFLEPAATGTGSINLVFELASGVSADSVTASGLSDTAVTLTESGSSFTLENDPVSSGRYTVTFNFNKVEVEGENTITTLVYSTTQEINVFPGMTTDRWIVPSAFLNEADAFCVTSAMVDNCRRTDYFVGNCGTAAPNDTTGRGSLYKPYATVAKAVEVINSLPSSNSQNNPIEYKLHIKDSLAEDIASAISINKHVTIECWKDSVNDKQGTSTLTWTGTTGSMFSIGSGGSLTIEGVKSDGDNPTWSGLVLDGNKDAGKTGQGITIAASGSLQMKGGEIRNFSYTSEGAGVAVDGSFTMAGGKISGNETSSNGAGVYVNGTDFSIKGSAYVASDNDVYLPSGKKITIAGALTPPAAANGKVAKITPYNYTSTNSWIELSTNPAPVPTTTLAAECGKFAVTPNGTQAYCVDSSGHLAEEAQVQVSESQLTDETSIDTFVAGLEEGLAYNIVLPSDFTDTANITAFLKKIGNSNIGMSTVDLSGINITEISGTDMMKNNIETLILPSALTKLGNQVLESAKDLEEIVISENNAYYTVENGILYDKNKTTLIRYPPAKAESSFTLPDTVKKIGYGAFRYDKNLEVINGLNQIEELNDKCTFSYMAKIKELDLSGLTVTSLPLYSFRESSVEKVYLSSSITSIGGDAFYGCSKLTEIHFKTTTPPTLGIANGRKSFQGCNSDIKFYVPAGSKSAYSGATGSFANSEKNYFTSSLENRIIEE